MLYCVLTHLIPRLGSLESRVVVVLDAGREHGHGGIWTVGHEADVIRGLLLLWGLLRGKKVRGIHGHLGKLGYVLRWTHVVGRTDVQVHGHSWGVARRGKKRGGGHGAGTERAQGALGRAAGETARNGGQRAVATQIGLVGRGGCQLGIK